MKPWEGTMTGLLKTAVRVFALACLAAASTAAHAEDIVVTHYASLLYGTPYAVALEKGYFKDAGVDISGILTSKGGGTSVRNMMAGDTLFAEVALPAVLSAVKEGFKIKIISGGTDGPSGFWVTRPDAPINKPEDLKGKRFVYSRPKSVSEAQIFAILKSHNIPVSDVKMVAIGDFGAGITALEHDKVDIAIIPEPIYSQKVKEGAKYKVLPWLDAKVPPSNQTVGIATDETIAKRADKLKAVIEARRRGVELIYKDPKQAAAILAKTYNLAPDVAANAIENTLKQTPTWWSNGELKRPLMDEMSAGLGAVGALELPVDWKTVIADGFAPPSDAKP
jgi:NitT/TauT family transport system substrate-binding protein